MSIKLTHRSLLTLKDFQPAEIRYLLDLAHDLKQNKIKGTEVQRLIGKNIALIFEKTSTRTRCAFEVAIHDQGGHVSYIDPNSSQLGHKESIKDTARVLGRFYDGIGYRGFLQTTVEELAEYSKIPVWNALTNDFHPTQILADLLTMEEQSQKPLHDISFCYLGDARFNMGNSLLIGATKMGMDVRIGAPKQFWPNEDLVRQMQELAQTTGARITLETDPYKAVKGADFLHTDVWLSMGEPKELWSDRIQQLKAYQITKALMQATENTATKFMHCLPALHNLETHLGQEIFQQFDLKELEVSDEVFESEASIVFSQAENRLHTIKAVLVATLT